MSELVFGSVCSGIEAASVAWHPLGWRAAFVGPVLRGGLHYRPILYAVLSLTIVRMLPVALSLVGVHLRRDTIGFVGWFGPRGLASVVFTLVAFDALGGHAELRYVVTAIAIDPDHD